MRIAWTRAMIRAALSGALDAAGYERDPVFNLEVPRACPDVPDGVLVPRNAWTSSQDYDRQASKLARMFGDNFKARAFQVEADVVARRDRERERSRARAS